MSDNRHHQQQQPDLAAHFHKLNMSAQPFVPNAHTPAFQPGNNYGQMYGAQPYHMTGQHRPGMYPGMPYHVQGMGYGGYGPHGGGGAYIGGQQPQQQGRPPLHQMNPHSHVNQSEYSPNRTGGNNYMKPQQQQQHYQQQPTSINTAGGGGVASGAQINSLPKNSINSTTTPPSKFPVQSNDDIPVDSWEDLPEDTPTTNEATPTTKEDTPNSKTDTPINKPDVDTTESVSSTNSIPSIDTPPEQREHVLTTTKVEKKSTKDVPSSSNSSASSISEAFVPKSAKIQQPVLKKKEDEKENVNIVFIGHVDAGKSTIGGHLMFLTGQVDKRTLEKYEREAREKNRETWYLSWALDTNQEERDKGKTVDVGRGSFETDKKRFTILDAPGHAGFVPNMISGTVQADVGILVISARRGEFETGFERRGQTREHAMLAKTAGVRHLVILVNKMDDPTVKWDEARYEDIKTKLTPFLKKVGFNPKTDIHYIPVSGLTGANLKTPATDSCPWYRGLPFLPYLEALPPIVREDAGPLRFPIADKHKDMGTIVMGKVESGSVGKGSILIMMPNKSQVEVLSVTRDEDEVDAAFSGDNIKLKLKGVEEEDVSPGFVLCPPNNLCHFGRVFDAQMVVLEYKSIICAGFSCVIHIHTVIEVVEILSLIGRIDKKTGKKIPEKPKFIKQDHTAIVRFQTSGVICMETFKDFAPMARFTLRDEGKTIAIGKVLRIVE